MSDGRLSRFWASYRDVIFIALFVSIFILIFILFEYNYKLTEAVSKLWDKAFPLIGVR